MTGSERPRLAVAIWIVVLGLSAWQLARTRVIADLGAFLPPSATPTQQLLLEQMRSGVASRILLIALGGADEERLAAASRTSAAEMRASGLFASVQNGADEGLRGDREAFMNYRYVLSPAVAAERFSAPALRKALESALGELATQPGSAARTLLPRDPTGELRRIVERLPASAPAKRGGVWFSADGKRALLVAETIAGGFDAVAQEKAIEVVQKSVSGLSLEISGAGVFAAASRTAIEREAWLLSLVSGTLILLLLLRIYRRPGIVALCFVPVASGIAVGTAAVSLAFGNVHAITLGFGATLIGEAVDYPSYACLNAAPGESLRRALERIWPTLRLAVLTTVLGGLTMLLSSFSGLAQLGLLTMSGVLVAGLVTRDVVPVLAGPGPVTTRPYAVSWSIENSLGRVRRFAPLVWALAAAAVLVLYFNREKLWEDDLQAMNPVPEHLKAADRELRRELGAPDVRHLVVLRGENREVALERAEALEGKLDALVRRGAIRGYDLATRYVPSIAEQKRRLAALPEPPILKTNLEKALQGLPFQRGVFEPFLRDVEESRKRGPLGAADLRGTVLGMKFETLVTPIGSDWVVLIPLYGVADSKLLADEVAMLDLKAESERLLAGYRLEALRLSALGMGAIVLALALGLRRTRAVLQVVLPVALALVLTAAVLQLAGQRLTVFHLIAMLLVMGIGLNYSLFFDRPEADVTARRRTIFALLVTCATTVLAFGTLAWSSNPVLHAIGLTVTTGALAAFFASAALARR
ncbi:MAG TPA: MMPL family transporter [Burkholderiales bacterium]|nr:MMPL family transporter [Burkholderiales bacterium]